MRSVKSAFALLLSKVTKPGIRRILADKERRAHEADNQCHDRKRVPES